MKLKANCPTCKAPLVVEEVMIDVTVTSEVNGFSEHGLDYGEQTNEDGEVLGYACTACGKYVEDDFGAVIVNSEELFDFFDKSGWLV